MMSRIKFWLDKFYFMGYFIRYGLWGMAWSEWKMTHEELSEAVGNFPQVEKKGVERLQKAIRKEEEKYK